MNTSDFFSDASDIDEKQFHSERRRLDGSRATARRKRAWQHTLAARRREKRRLQCHNISLMLSFLFLLCLWFQNHYQSRAKGSNEEQLHFPSLSSHTSSFCPGGYFTSHLQTKLHANTSGTKSAQTHQNNSNNFDNLTCATPIPVSAAATLTVVTYNAEWLFDGYDDPYRSTETAQEHVLEVARILDTLDADIINVIEVSDV